LCIVSSLEGTRTWLGHSATKTAILGDLLDPNPRSDVPAVFPTLRDEHPAQLLARDPLVRKERRT